MKSLAFGHIKFNRNSIPESLKELSEWPGVDESSLSNEDRETFKARREAIRIFIEEPSVPLASIERTTGVSTKTLYRLIPRCIEKHEDGRIYGFRAAIPYARLKDYERIEPVSSISARTSGLSGAFAQLVYRYPNIKKYLQKVAKERIKKIDGVREGRRSLRKVHKQFLDECRKAGVRANEYPFTQSLGGIRSLASYLKKLSEESFEIAARSAGAAKVGPAHPGSSDTAPPALRPFEVVEFDGHKIDLRITVKVKDPFGMETLFEMTRIWILVLLDIATRAVIGYSLALDKEYNKDDVASALQNALTPHKSRQFKIPGLSIRKEGGFPSGIFPKVEYACWDWFRFDGAKAHIANDTLERLTQVIGCWTDNGKAGDPNDRPFIERFFSLIAEHFAHRLPGTTGSNPDAIEKLLNDPGSDISLLVELEELEEMIEVLLGDYNGESRDGIGGKTPLEAMSYHLNKPDEFIRTLPKMQRSNLCLLQEARVVPIRGSLKQGVRPHINFCEVRYSSDILSNNPALIGQKVRIYFDVRDIRVVKAFFEDGSELGILTAARPWCYTPHSLRVRQEINRLKREGKLKYREGDDPVEAWTKYKRAQAKTSKRAANALAKHQSHIRDRDKPLRQDIPKPAAAETPPLDTDSSPVIKEVARQETSPQPRPLKLRKTFVF